jgi:hypothetical protein
MYRMTVLEISGNAFRIQLIIFRKRQAMAAGGRAAPG